MRMILNQSFPQTTDSGLNLHQKVHGFTSEINLKTDSYSLPLTCAVTQSLPSTSIETGQQYVVVPVLRVQSGDRKASSLVSV